MDIATISQFKIFDRQEGTWRHVYRDCFSNIESFVFQRRTQDGKVLNDFRIIESTAVLCLTAALKSQEENPDRFSVEITKFS